MSKSIYNCYLNCPYGVYRNKIDDGKLIETKIFLTCMMGDRVMTKINVLMGMNFIPFNVLEVMKFNHMTRRIKHFDCTNQNNMHYPSLTYFEDEVSEGVFAATQIFDFLNNYELETTIINRFAKWIIEG